MQSWTSPGGNTPQDTNCTATCLLSWKLFKLDEPDMQDTAGEAGTNSWEMYSHGPPHMAVQKQDDQHENKFSSYVRIWDVVRKTYLGRWTIGRSGERVRDIRATSVTWWWWMFSVEMLPLWLKHMYSVLCELKRRPMPAAAYSRHYDWSLLNYRDIRDEYALTLRNKFDAQQDRSETRIPNNEYENLINAH